MKILTVLGARPQFIKAATVSRELQRAGLREVLVHTGQHYDHNMSRLFFEEMDIPEPDYNLGVKDLGHGAMTGRMLEGIEQVLLKEQPDRVLVYGDTNSTLAGALAAVKLHIPVAHVEAGLRSFNQEMPEEINRMLTDRISSLLFCPTRASVENLHKEGLHHLGGEIVQSGDVMYDSVLYYRDKIPRVSRVMEREKMSGKDFVLATVHRAETTADVSRLKAICEALNDIHTRVTVILPLHPRTRASIASNKIQLTVKVIEPIGYFDMLALLETCRLVMTDSGGLQKESYFFGKFCITLRDQTEWTELIEAGVNALAGASREKILELFRKNIDRAIIMEPGLYGDGRASQKIAERLKRG